MRSNVIEGALVKYVDHFYGDQEYTRNYRLDIETGILEQKNGENSRTFKITAETEVGLKQVKGKQKLEIANLMEGSSGDGVFTGTESFAH